jgi:hypothetical protein
MKLRDEIINAGNVAFTFTVASSDPRKEEHPHDVSFAWTNSHNVLTTDGKYVIHPYGYHDRLPNVIQEVVHNNYIAPGLLNKNLNLLWGAGPVLYTESIENNERVRNLVIDNEVEDWLESWDYLSYITKVAVDYQYMQGAFTKFIQSKAFKTGSRSFVALEHLPLYKTRLASTPNSDYTKATHAVVRKYTNDNTYQQEVYPLFDRLNPYKNPNSVMYSNLYSFCSDYYSVPLLYGALEWLRQSTAVPLIFKAMSDNSINLKFHIESPQLFWDGIAKKLDENCQAKNVEYTNDMLEEYKLNYLTKIGEVLSGIDNTGKFLHTISSFDVDGQNLMEYGWKINVIDQKVKDFVEANIKISERADQAVAGAINLGHSLGNTSSGGATNSGSEQYYSLVGHLNTNVDLPEMFIMRPVNCAIKANFPKKNLKLGFTYNVTEKQQNITPSERTSNQNALKK